MADGSGLITVFSENQSSVNSRQPSARLVELFGEFPTQGARSISIIAQKGRES
jgi:hypothetical protein